MDNPCHLSISNPCKLIGDAANLKEQKDQRDRLLILYLYRAAALADLYPILAKTGVG